MLNIPQNIFVGQLINTQQGPVITTQVYDEKSMTYLDVYEWEVFNGARLVAPLPFGMFGQISQINMNKSRLQLRIAPGYTLTPSAPVFAITTEKDVNYDHYLSNATIIRQVVPPTFDLSTIDRTDFWDITLEPLDESHSVLTKIYADSPKVYGYDTIRDLYVTTPYTEEIVTPEEMADEITENGYNPAITFTPVDVFHTLRRESNAPIEAMTNFNLSFPTRFNLDLPQVLKSVNTIWNIQQSQGTQDTMAFDHSDGESGSLSMSIPDSASSAAAVTAEIQVTFEEFVTHNLYLTTHIVYMPPPVNKATILAKVNTIYGLVPPATAKYWPIFKPRSETIVVTGQSISVRANVQVAMHESWSPSNFSNGWTKSVSDDFSVGLSSQLVQIPPCIHGAITIQNSADKNLSAVATAWMNIISDHGTGVDATKTKGGTAFGRISPKTLNPTSGQSSIPTSGIYIMDVDVAPYDYGWFKVRIDVFDATALA
jgi:hypothetical protein